MEKTLNQNQTIITDKIQQVTNKVVDLLEQDEEIDLDDSYNENESCEEDYEYELYDDNEYEYEDEDDFFVLRIR